VIGIDATDAILCSAKTGLGVDDILEAVISAHPAAQGRSGGTAEGADHRFVVRQLRRRRHAGARRRWHAAPKDKILLMATGTQHLCEQVGVFTPKSVQRSELRPGRSASSSPASRNSKAAKVGDTVTMRSTGEPRRCPASRKSSRRCSPACIRSRPTSTIPARLAGEAQAQRRLAALRAGSFAGAGLRLPLRLPRPAAHGNRAGASGARVRHDLITTAPTVVYEVLMRDGAAPSRWKIRPNCRTQKIEEIREPIITTIFVPQEYVGAVITLCKASAARR
jgi:GTP-binding protein LepA